MDDKKKTNNENKKNEKLEFQWKKAGKTSFIWITIILSTCKIAESISLNCPPSLKESGVTFNTPVVRILDGFDNQSLN